MQSIFIWWSLVNILSFLGSVKPQATLYTCCQHENECGGIVETHVVSKDVTNSSRLPKYLPLPEKSDFLYNLKFRLTPGQFICSNDNFTVTIPSTHETDDGDNTTTIFKIKEMPIIDVPVKLLELGYLKYGIDNYSPNEYCISRITNDELTMIVCNTTCGSKTPCITKCCDIGEVWDLSEYPDGPIKCKSSQNIWNPVLYSDPYTKTTDPEVKPHIITSHPRMWCVDNEPTISSWKPLEGDKKTPFRILQDGKAWYKFDRRQWASFTDGLYCVDGSMNRPGDFDILHPDVFTGFENDTIVVDCVPPLEQPPISATSEIYGISMVFSSCFLLVTVIVYILLWEKQNVHGWTLLCYFASLFFMYLLLSAVHFTSMTMVQSEFGGNSMCHAIGILAHFFFLSCFCWMSTVNFDLWWTFRTLKPTGNRSKGIKRFLTYLLFSLGVPGIIVSVALTLDFVYGPDDESLVIVPDYGKKWCYMEKKYAPLPYLYGPIGFLLFCNLIFFTVTIYAMYKIQQSTKFATSSSSKSNKQKQSVKIFGKLFLIMGIPWLTELISWSSAPEAKSLPWFWVIFDLINIFQAIAIFMIFVFKKETFNSLEGKYPSFQPVTLRPDTAQTILERHPRLRFIITPFTRSPPNQRNFSSRKTQSTVTETSRSRRSSGLEADDNKDKFSVEMVESEPRGGLA